MLVVDDNTDAAQSLSLLLRSWGHHARVAYDGLAALREVEANPPDVVLLDIGLPGPDGYEVARRLRQGPAGAALVLIALTGYGQESDRRRAREAGFDHHLLKPVEPGRLREVLMRHTAPAKP